MEFQVVAGELEAVVVHLGMHEAVVSDASQLIFLSGPIVMDPNGMSVSAGISNKVHLATFRCLGASGSAAFGAAFPGHVRRIDLDGRAWLCQREALIVAGGGLEFHQALRRQVGTGCYGPGGFVLWRISGDGTLYLHAGGNQIEFGLEEGQSIQVDTACLVAWEESVEYEIRFVGGFPNSLYGGDGSSITALTGPGRVIVQTLPPSRLAGRVLASRRETAGVLRRAFADRHGSES